MAAAGGAAAAPGWVLGAGGPAAGLGAGLVGAAEGSLRRTTR